MDALKALADVELGLRETTAAPHLNYIFDIYWKPRLDAIRAQLKPKD